MKIEYLLPAVVLCTVFSTITQADVIAKCISENDNELPQKQSKLNLYRGEMDFTLSLLDAINKATPTENVFFSSYSIFHTLLLAYFGSYGRTEATLKTALKLDWAPSKAHVMHAYHSEKKNRALRNSSIEFASADRIYLNSKDKVRDCMKNLFDEELQSLDFVSDPEGSRLKINNWITELTKGHIKDMLPSGSLTPNTNLVLANAAYFKGTWVSKFDAAETKQENFYVTPDKIRFVDMMNLKGNFYYSSNEHIGAHVLELPYDGHDISMFIVLPPQQNSLENVLDRLNVETLQEALSDGISREVYVSLPKFGFEKQLELLPVLTKLGVGELFSSSANLTGFTGSPLTLDDALHKSKIEVDENGATAASATVLFSFRSSRPLEPAVFKCNHPFFFFIYDNKSNAILFSGIYRDPDN